jgi:hypothetical protein
MTNVALLSRVMNRLKDTGCVRPEPCAATVGTNLVLTDNGWNKVIHAAAGPRPDRRGEGFPSARSTLVAAATVTGGRSLVDQVGWVGAPLPIPLRWLCV